MAAKADRVRVSILDSHPIQYKAPVYRRLARCAGIELRVHFFATFGHVPTFDSEFGREIRWDVPLLDGYDHEFLTNWAPRPGSASFLGTINPGLLLSLSRFRSDAVMVCGYARLSCLIGVLAAKWVGAGVSMVGDSTLSSGRSGLAGRIRDKVLPVLFSAFDAVGAVGTQGVEYFRHHGVPPDRICEVPYAIDVARFADGASRARPSRAETLRGMGLDPGRPTALFSGKLVPRKRPLDLLRALAGLAPERRCNVLYIGEGQQLEELQEYSRNAGLHRVAFAKFVNQQEMPRYLSLGDVLVLPSSRESWGLVVNEAMAAGLAVIVSTSAGCSNDLVVEGTNGYTFAAGDADTLARHLRSLLDEPDRWKEMGAESARIISGWDLERSARGILRVVHRSLVSVGKLEIARTVEEELHAIVPRADSQLDRPSGPE